MEVWLLLSIEHNVGARPHRVYIACPSAACEVSKFAVYDFKSNV